MTEIEETFINRCNVLGINKSLRGFICKPDTERIGKDYEHIRLDPTCKSNARDSLFGELKRLSLPNLTLSNNDYVWGSSLMRL